MPSMRALCVSVIVCGACHDPAPPPPQQPTTDGSADPALAQDREDFITDAVAFTGLPRAVVIEKSKAGNTSLKDEWNEWEKQGPMTDDRIKAFYKQTVNYLFDLAGWHLWMADKRASDVEFVEEMKKSAPKNILDFGGGVGFNSLMLAKAGFDVTLADLDSQTIAFAKLRAERHGIKLKFWKSDVEPVPPDAKYDAILCLDVLEHLPQAELKSTVDKLVRLKKPTTQIIIHAPFGKTASHPMHLDETDETKRQIERLKTEQPPV